MALAAGNLPAAGGLELARPGGLALGLAYASLPVLLKLPWKPWHGGPWPTGRGRMDNRGEHGPAHPKAAADRSSGRRQACWNWRPWCWQTPASLAAPATGAYLQADTGRGGKLPAM